MVVQVIGVAIVMPAAKEPLEVEVITWNVILRHASLMPASK